MTLHQNARGQRVAGPHSPAQPADSRLGELLPAPRLQPRLHEGRHRHLRCHGPLDAAATSRQGVVVASDEVLPKLGGATLGHHLRHRGDRERRLRCRSLPRQQPAHPPARQSAGGRHRLRPRASGVLQGTEEDPSASEGGRARGLVSTCIASHTTAITSAGSCHSGLWRGLSRMRGNPHVRFLGELGVRKDPGLTRRQTEECGRLAPTVATPRVHRAGQDRLVCSPVCSPQGNLCVSTASRRN
jgi:hypothetical protein